MTPRFTTIAAAAAAALLQACVSQPLEEDAQPSSEAPAVMMPAAVPEPPPPPAPVAKAAPAPAPAPAPSTPLALDATRLPPFEGERAAVDEPLRGLPTIDRTAPAGDLWQRIRVGFAMRDLDNSLVRKKTAQYAAQPEYLQRIFDRSRLYLFHIVEEIEKRGLPTELALLPMVESAFNPMAYSRAHASGLWQFIPGTGRRYDLTQNHWYDGRRDVVDSTNAALDYLTFLYQKHGDWHLALAAYNWGEGAVGRAVARNRAARKPIDYSSLRMPRETRYYVPKLQALKNIISNPEPYGITLEPIPNRPYFAVITETPDIDLQLAARLAEMPVEEFVALNPGFSRPLIRAEATARIVLPADKVETFHDNLANHDEESLVSWEVYYPQRGESLGRIAKKFELSVAELKRVNGISLHSSKVPKVLVVPMNGEATEHVARLPIMYAPPIPVPGAVRAVHVVRGGDTLSGIAARYRVRVSDLRNWNRINGYLQIGQRIYIRAR